jgi:hypothetical protein
MKVNLIMIPCMRRRKNRYFQVTLIQKLITNNYKIVKFQKIKKIVFFYLIIIGREYQIFQIHSTIINLIKKFDQLLNIIIIYKL